MIKRNKLMEGISNHIKSNLGLYFLVFAFLMAGITAGAFTIKSMDDIQRQSLIKYLQGFFQVLTSKNIDTGAIFIQSLKNNIQTVFIIWILGITVIGIPITLLVIGMRGFIVGFTVAFLLNNLGWKGLIFTTLVILPQNLIIIPCIICIGVISINYSTIIIKERLSRKWVKNFKQRFISYCLLVLMLFIISVLGSLIEAYITPLFMKLLSSYLYTT